MLSLETYIYIIVSIVGLLAVFTIPKAQEYYFKAPLYYPYKKRNLLTKNEYPFFMQLRDICEEEGLYVCTKVRLEDLCYTTSKSHVKKFRGYINSRHVDFIICDREMHILAAIELDDPSHNSKEAKKIDNFKNDLFSAIDIPLYRVKTDKKNKYGDNIRGILSLILK